jgi:hypothetical protein
VTNLGSLFWVCVVVLFAPTVMPAQMRSGKTRTGIAYDVRGKGPVVVLISGSNCFSFAVQQFLPKQKACHPSSLISHLDRGDLQ